MPTNDVLVESEQSPLSRSSKFTLQEQLVHLLTEKIRNKEYAQGDKLPSVREMAHLYRISRETAKLALDALKERGYVEILPSRGAFVLDGKEPAEKRQKTGTLGIVLDIGRSSRESYDFHMVYDNLLRYVDEEATQRGFHLMTSYVGFSHPDGITRFWSMLEKIDGLIVAGLFSRELESRLADLPVPVVSILSNRDVDGVDDIGVDNRKSYRNAAENLLRKGCRTLMYMDGPEEYFQQKQRWKGCEEALRAYGEDNASIRRILSTGWLPEDGKASLLHHLEEGTTPDGILCVNDVIAVGALQACRQRGLRIPEDVKIIGGKNTLLSRSAHPPLSSIDCHYDAIAVLALERMAEGLAGNTKTPVKVELLGTLVERESTNNREY